MKSGTKALIAEEGGKLLSGAIRAMILRPRHKEPTPTTDITQSTPTTPEETTTTNPPIVSVTPSSDEIQKELDYRWECVMKHLGGASILLREAYERVLDDGIGDGTAEKIMEALNEHSGMEADLEKMLDIPDAKEQAERLMSGVRSFRNAAWKAKLPSGGGTKEDIDDARLWNGILYQEAYVSAKAQPGQECIREEVE